MATKNNQKIRDMVELLALTGKEMLPLAREGKNYKVTTKTLSEYIGSTGGGSLPTDAAAQIEQNTENIEIIQNNITSLSKRIVAINSRVTDLEDADFVDIDSLRSTLEGYYTKEQVDDLLGEAGGVDLTGYVNEIAASGTGNGIASVSKDGSKLTFTKANFLTSHQSLDGYINSVSDEGSGNVVTAYRKSGKSLVLQKGLSVYSKAEVDELIDDISIPSLDGYVTTDTLTESLNNLSNTYLSFRDGGTVSGATIFSGGLSVQNSLTLLGVNVAAGSSGLTFGGKIPMYSGDAYTKSEADKKFHPLTTVDTTPTSSSTNLITSGGVFKMVADLDESISSNFLLKTTAASTYLPLDGGELTGRLIATAGGSGATSISYANAALTIGTVNRKGTTSAYYPGISFNHMYTFDSGTQYRNHAHAWIGLRLYDTPIAERSYLIFATNGDSTTGTSPVERMCIAPNGNVGIGTTDPKYKLDVNGSFNATSGYIDGNTLIHSGNIGNQSVNYANGTADILSKQPQLAAATESNAISIVDNSNGSCSWDTVNEPLASITKAIQFNWYGHVWHIGGIRGSGDFTDWFGITHDKGTPVLRVHRTGNSAYLGSNALIHSGNIGSYAVTPSNLESTLSDYPLANGTRATGTWGIDISGSAAKLDSNALMSQISDWNSGFSSSIFRSSEDAVPNSPNGDFTYGIHLRFHRDTNTYYTDLVTNLYNDLLFYRRHTEHGFGEWKTIAFTDSTVANATNFSNHSINEFAQYLPGNGYIQFNLLDSDIHSLGKGDGYIEYYDNGGWYNSAWGKVTAVDGFVGNLSGTATAANKLSTARTIWGQSFDGSGDVSGVLWLYSNNNYYSYLEGDTSGVRISTWQDGVAYLPIILNPWGGNVGIGTTNPNTKLHVVGGAQIEGALSSYGITATTTAATDAAFTHYVGSTKLWWVSSYNNCANFHTALYVQSGSSPIKVATVNDLSSYLLKAGDTISGSLTFSSTSGSHIIGNSNSEIIFQPSNDTGSANIPLKIAKTGSSTYTMYCDESEVYDLGTSSYKWNILYCRSASQSSDATLKNILGNVALTTSQIANAPAVNFTWKNGGAKDVGTIAQYWKDVLPEVVSGDEGSYGMNYAVLGVVSSIILARNIETHEQRIARLEKEISDLQKELNALVNNE